MTREAIARLAEASPRYAAALLGVAVMTALIAVVIGTVHVANISMLYLLVVLIAATRFGSGPAVFGAIVAFLSFNWFFVPPTHTFTVAEPGEWVSLLLFL